MSTRIGFIGLGLMGHGMAKNLLEKGFPITTKANRNRAPLEDLIARGATEAPSPKAIAEASDVVIMCVTGTPEVESVIYGKDGILAGIRPGMTVIDCSTSEPASTLRIAADLKDKGADFVDAPLARSPVDAEAGRLNTMVGADDAVFEKIRPVLETFCENIFHVGAVGNGHKIKLIYNFMTQGTIAMIAEALGACAATGIDLEDFYELITAGGANCGIFQMIVPGAIREGSYDGLGFSMANSAKDLQYYVRMINEVPMNGTIAAAVRHNLIEGVNLGMGDRMVGALIEAQAKINGIDIIKK